MDERLPKWTAWLFSTPWWVPALLACVLTLWVIWQSYLAMKEEHGRRNNADLDIIGNAPSLTSLKIQFFDGNQIPKKIDSKNVYQLYVKSNFTYHPLEVEKQYLGMWRVTVFIVFESDMPVGTVDIDCQNCELPPYHIEQQSMRHLLVTFNNVLNKAILTIDINKAEKIVNPY